MQTTQVAFAYASTHQNRRDYRSGQRGRSDAPVHDSPAWTSLDSAWPTTAWTRRLSDSTASAACPGDEGRRVGILVDLPGPKVRAGNFGESGVDVPTGGTIELRVGEASSTSDLIEVDYEFLMRDIQIGDRVTIGDGGAVLEITDKQVDKMLANVIAGSRLRGRPGVHIPSDRLQIPTPTPEDFVALDAFVDAGVDMVAVSFVRSAHDMRRVGTEPHLRGPLLIAKIETRAAVDNLPGIIEASGAVMVARGDLGNECSLEDLPHLQKDIIRQCIAGGRPVITATQMLESMVTSPAPTRAEASDVANAVFDGSSAVMLSGRPPWERIPPTSFTP